jgi:hypothetical protein
MYNEHVFDWHSGKHNVFWNVFKVCVFTLNQHSYLQPFCGFLYQKLASPYLLQNLCIFISSNGKIILKSYSEHLKAEQSSFELLPTDWWLNG